MRRGKPGRAGAPPTRARRAPGATRHQADGQANRSSRPGKRQHTPMNVAIGPAQAPRRRLGYLWTYRVHGALTSPAHVPPFAKDNRSACDRRRPPPRAGGDIASREDRGHRAMLSPPEDQGAVFDGPHERAGERPGAPWGGGAAGCKGQHRARGQGGIAAPQAQRSSAPRPPTPASGTREATPMTTGMHTVTDWSPGDAGPARKFRPAFASHRRTSHRKDHVRPRHPTRRQVPLRGLPSTLSPGRRDHLHTRRASGF